MFRCGVCDAVQLPKTQPTRLVMDVREVKYPSGSTGVEIVEELGACKECAVNWLNQHPHLNLYREGTKGV